MGFTFLYIDPGTGYIIIQAIIAMFVAIGVYYKKLKNFILSRFKKNE
jgi:hypothetical protein